MNKGLENAAKRRAEMAARGEAVQIRSPLEKWESDPTGTGFRGAVDAKCWDCMGGRDREDTGYVKRDIRDCTASPDSGCPCPLWPLRPYRRFRG